MNRERPEWEINLKSMLFAAVYRWKLVVAVAVALALLFGGYQAISVWRARDNDTLRAQYKVDQTKYKNTKATLEENVESLNDDIQEQEEYLEKSILMQLDHREIYRAKVNLYLNTPYQIMPDKVYQNMDRADQILAFYVSALSDQLLLEDIAKQLDTEPKYLSEILHVDTSLNHILSIVVSWTDEAGVKAVKDALLAQANSYYESISQKVGEHTLTVVLDTIGTVVDTGVFDHQERELERMKNYELQLAEKEIELRELVEPVLAQVAVKDVLRAAVKWAIVGSVLGAVLTVAMCCAVYIFSNKVYSGADLQARCGVQVLGSMPGNMRLDRLTRRIYRTEGRSEADLDEVPVFLQETLRQYAQGATNILITGDVDPQLAEEYAQRLQQGMADVRLTAYGSVLEDARAVRALAECDAVLMLQKCGKSNYQRICREATRINDAKKPLVGCITVEW